MADANATLSGLITGFKSHGKPQSQASSAEDKPKSRYWLNVGIKAGDKLVCLPRGIPLSGLEAKQIPGANTKNPEFRQLRQAEAELWEAFKQILEGMKPGDTMELPALTCELRMVEDTEESSEEQTTNPFSVAALLTQSLPKK